MTDEKRKILDKVNALINKRKAELFEEFLSFPETDNAFAKLEYNSDDYQIMKSKKIHMAASSNL